MRSNTILVLGLTLAFVLVTGFGSVGCSREPAKKIAEKIAEKQIERASGGKAKVDLGSSGAVDISDLPEVLRYPGGKPIGRWSVSEERGKGSSYIFETDNPASSVVDHYKKALVGWKESMVMQSEKGTVMAFQTGDEKQSAVVTVGFDDDKKKTTVTIVYSTK